MQNINEELSIYLLNYVKSRLKPGAIFIVI